MPRVLIAGCGYVGSATADLFHADGWEVEGWTGSRESAAELASKPYCVRAVDLTDKISGDVAFDVVVHCASTRGGDAADYQRVFFEGARHLAESFPTALLIFTSSTSVYAQTNGDWVTEESAAEPTHERGQILRRTEELVLQHGGIVSRLSGIYGPGRSALLRKFLAGTAAVEDRFVNQAHRDDIAAALLLLARVGKRTEIYNIADGHPLPQRDACAWLAKTLQRPMPPAAQSLPERKRGRSNKRVSSEKLQALGWSPEFPDFATAMSQSILPSLATCGA